jgi:pectate lyase
MTKAFRLFSVLTALMFIVFLFSCESRQKSEVGHTNVAPTSAGPVVDVSKQTPLQGPFPKESGFAWRAVNLSQYQNSADNPKDSSQSKLVFYEDGKPLGPAHSMHDDIRTKGAGRYSHWVDTLYFSTSDNSDPNTNGKKYSISISN